MATLGYAYCVLHDIYFADHNDRDRHIQSSDDHPQCHICDRRFKDRNALRNHWIVAKYHYYCADCDKHFNTAAGLEYHIDEIHVGGDDSDDEDECSDESEHYDGWEDDRGMDRYPDGVPAESQAHKLGVNDDNSWEIWDDLDFEDQEDLMDPSEPSLDDYASNSDDEVDEDDEEHLSHHFECPMVIEPELRSSYAVSRDHSAITLLQPASASILNRLKQRHKAGSHGAGRFSGPHAGHFGVQLSSCVDLNLLILSTLNEFFLSLFQVNSFDHKYNPYSKTPPQPFFHDALHLDRFSSHSTI
ncbi:zinc-finger-containing protein [Lentinula edodes]|uniref:Zinc-finger-containing protein n=1 Tax=Lentinula edodes TaxID=5353 RepID=A0A1Q3EFD3_LENED|nr:zinc-finger-containing protein [Lentinula edodes]